MLRGIAALCVLGLHVEWIYNLSPRLFAKSYLAVDLFFMLSGYVMARTYEPRMAQGLAPLRFLLTRYRRLWPVMAIGCLIGLPKLFVDTPNPAVFTAAATLNLLLLPLPWKELAFPMNIPAWSIFLELAAIASAAKSVGQNISCVTCVTNRCRSWRVPVLCISANLGTASAITENEMNAIKPLVRITEK